MNEIPVSSKPFQYSIPDRTSAKAFDPTQESIGMGSKYALKLAAIYAVGLSLILFLSSRYYPITLENIRDFNHVLTTIVQQYGLIAMVGAISFVVGVIPAMVVVWVNGWITGFIFRRWIKMLLPFRESVIVAFVISSLCLALRLWFGVIVLKGWYWGEFFIWLFWYIPNLIAFFAWAWVVYQVNQKMPTS